MRNYKIAHDAKRPVFNRIYYNVYWPILKCAMAREYDMIRVEDGSLENRVFVSHEHGKARVGTEYVRLRG